MSINVTGPEPVESGAMIPEKKNPILDRYHFSIEKFMPRAARAMTVLAFGGLLYAAAATAPEVELPPAPPVPELVSEVQETQMEEEEIIPEHDVLPHLAVGSRLMTSPQRDQIVLEVPYLKVFDNSQLEYLSLSSTLSAENGYHTQKLINQAALLDKQLAALPPTSKLYLEQEQVSLRRADARFTSLLFYGSVHAAADRLHYYYSADNYETTTGKTLLLSDVVNDIPALYELIQQQLELHWPYVTYDRSAAEYLAQTSAQYQVWTLDYNGITFFFEEGTLSSIDGEQCVTIPFSIAPSIFNEDCLEIPETYTISMAEGQPLYYDLDKDENPDEIVFTLLHNYYGDCEAFSLMINGETCNADLLLDGTHPESCSSYLRQTADSVQLVIETHCQNTDGSSASDNKLLTFSIAKDDSGAFMLIFEESKTSPLATTEATMDDGTTVLCHQIMTR